MRETRSSGSVEGVTSNRDPYSDSFNLSEFESRAWSLRAITGTGSAVASTAIPPMSMLRRLTSTVIMFPFLIIAYSTTNGPAPSEAGGPAPMAPNRWAWKKWINSASLIAAPWLSNRNLENRDFIIQVFQTLNSRRLESSDREPSARVEILPALARAPSHSMYLVATRKTPATASVNANFKFVRLSTLVFLALLNCRLRLSYSRLPRVSY
jgi:hypothetical protein